MSETAPHLVVVDEVDEPDNGLFGLIRRRVTGSYELDEWGMDVDATRIAGRIAGFRWQASVTGVEHLPTDGPALLVANRRLGWSEPVVLASALLAETGRIVRPVGGTDLDPVGGMLRRLGALPPLAGEVTAALRSGNLVLVPTRREPVRNRPGHLPIELLAAGVNAGVPVIPVAVIGWELSRRWQVRVGEPIQIDERPESRDDARADARLVGATAVAVSRALDELLVDAHEHEPLQRILSLVPALGGRGGADATDDGPADRWKGT